jgi:hypothetical protein
VDLASLQPALDAAVAARAAADAAEHDFFQAVKALVSNADKLAPPVGAAPLLPRPGGGAYLKLLSDATAAMIKGAKARGFKVGEGQIFAAATRVVFDVIGGMPFAAAVAKEIATLLPDGVTLPGPAVPPPNPVPNADSYGDAPPA